jgi:hypothetical protein
MEAIQQYRVGLQQQVEAKDNFLLQDRLRRRSGNA